MIPSDAVRKILTIKLGGLGDVFLSTIVIDSLKNHFSSAKIDYFVEKAGREAIMHDKRVNSIFVLEKEKMSPLSVIQHVRQQKYDMVIDLFGNPRSAIVTFLSGAKYKVGLDYGWRKHLYSIVGKAQRERLHGAEVNLQALKAIGVPVINPKLQYPLSSDDIAHADEGWKSNNLNSEFVIGILPAGSWPSKRCEPAKFAEIASTLAAKYNAKVLVVWGPSDEADAKEIQRRCGNAAILSPPASLSKNLSLLSRCTAIVANDSGPMHIASAFNVPTLCLYGPTYPEGPYGKIHEWVRNESLDCLVCNHLHCPIQHQCMRELPLDAVVEKFERMLEKNQVSRQDAKTQK
ncbi:MAG: glycosyltransferase family 9 protein [Bacteroidota bacterium]